VKQPTGTHWSAYFFWGPQIYILFSALVGASVCWRVCECFEWAIARVISFSLESVGKKTKQKQKRKTRGKNIIMKQKDVWIVSTLAYVGLMGR